MTITTEVDVTIHPEDIAAEVVRWSDADKRTFLVDIGLSTGEPTAFLPFAWPSKSELATIIERFLTDTLEQPAKWLADDIAGAILGKTRMAA